MAKMSQGRKPGEIIVAARTWGMDGSTHGNTVRNWIKRELTPIEIENMAVHWLQESLRGVDRLFTHRAEESAEDVRVSQDAVSVVQASDLEARRNAEALKQADRDAWEWKRISLMTNLLNEFADGLKMQWTNDLLDSEFGLRDGTRVLWGDATIEQHEERRTLFAKNAMANAEGSARHQAAINELRATGARTLRDLVKQVA